MILAMYLLILHTLRQLVIAIERVYFAAEENLGEKKGSLTIEHATSLTVLRILA